MSTQNFLDLKVFSLKIFWSESAMFDKTLHRRFKILAKKSVIFVEVLYTADRESYRFDSSENFPKSLLKTIRMYLGSPRLSKRFLQNGEKTCKKSVKNLFSRLIAWATFPVGLFESSQSKYGKKSNNNFFTVFKKTKSIISTTHAKNEARLSN